MRTGVHDDLAVQLARASHRNVAVVERSVVANVAIGLALPVGAGGATQRARHARAVLQVAVGRIHDDVDVLARDVAVSHLDVRCANNSLAHKHRV